jgi:hypothetical protein
MRPLLTSARRTVFATSMSTTCANMTSANATYTVMKTLNVSIDATYPTRLIPAYTSFPSRSLPIVSFDARLCNRTIASAAGGAGLPPVARRYHDEKRWKAPTYTMPMDH